MDWLGTDDQGRDVIAASSMVFAFGSVRLTAFTMASWIISIIAGAVRVSSVTAINLVFQRVMNLFDLRPRPCCLLMILAAFIAQFWICSPYRLLFFLDLARRRRPGQEVSCAAAIWMYRKSSSGLSNAEVDLQARPAQRHVVATLSLHPFHRLGLDARHPGLARLPALWASRLALARRTDGAGRQLHAPWLGITASSSYVADAVAVIVFVGGAVRNSFDPRKFFQ